MDRPTTDHEGVRARAQETLLNWHRLFESDTPPRLGIEVEKRIPYAAASGFATGFGLGYLHGSKRAGLVFRAENAHRFPTSSRGWYQYHRSKNHVAFVGGAKDGVKMGFKLGAGALAFALFEETVDYARDDERDFLSTVTAGLSFSGIYSLLGMKSQVIHPLHCATRQANSILGLKLAMTFTLLPATPNSALSLV